MRPRSVIRKHTTLPPKLLQCSLCSFNTALGQNDLQLHMDKGHKGWAEGVIRKLNIKASKD